MQSVYYTGRIGSGRRKSSNLYTMEEFVDNIINDFPDIAEECQYSDDFNNCLIETSGAIKRSFQRPHRRQGQRHVEHYRPRNYSFDGKRKSKSKSKSKSKRKSSKRKSKKRKSQK